MSEGGFHHRRLPDKSTVLTGRRPPNDIGWRSDRLQILYNNTTVGWTDDGRHSHTESDEVFIVLEGTVVVEVDGERVEIGPGEFCCFGVGVVHSVVETRPPLRTFMVRAPSIKDHDRS